MEKTEDALTQILEVLESKRGSFTIKQVIASVMSALFIAIILGIFAWSTSIGRTNVRLSNQIHDLDVSVRTYITNQSQISKLLKSDIDYNFSVISKKIKLDISLKEIK